MVTGDAAGGGRQADPWCGCLGVHNVLCPVISGQYISTSGRGGYRISPRGGRPLMDWRLNAIE